MTRSDRDSEVKRRNNALARVNPKKTLFAGLSRLCGESDRIPFDSRNIHPRVTERAQPEFSPQL